MRSAVLWSAAVLGAIVGALLGAPLAGACSCDVPSWTLRLREPSDAAEDASAWPAEALLESRPGTVIITSKDMSGATIDHVHAGDP